MEIAGIVFHQVVIMFLLLAVGFILIKLKILSPEVNRGLCGILLKLVIPSSIISAYIKPFSVEQANQLALAFGLALIFHLMAALYGTLVFRKKEELNHKMQRLAIVYSNCAFMGLPLLLAIFGEIGVFLGSAFIAIFNIFVWIHGIKTLNEKERIRPFKIICNPGTVAVLIGVLTYFLQIPYPPVVIATIRHIGGMTTPLAMIVVGGFLAAISLKEMIKDGSVIFTSLSRLLFLPLLFILLLFLLRVSYWTDSSRIVALSMIVAAACPAAATVVILPEMLHFDVRHGTKILALSTLLCIITLPLVVWIAYLVL